MSIFTAADDYFHDLDDPAFEGWDRRGWFNESSFFSFNVPERDLNGEMYVHHRVNREAMWAGAVLWDTTGHRQHDCLRWDWSLWPRPEGSELLDFELPNSLTFRTIEPLKQFEFSYRAEGFEAELAWVGVTEPQGVLPKKLGSWSTGHFDQFGRMTGQITLDGERLGIDCLSCRDRSWGPHGAREMPRGGYSFGIADENNGFLVYAISDLDAEDDPWFDTTEPVFGGWLVKDGAVEVVTGGERRVERLDDTRPTREIITFEDQQGRQFVADGEVRNHLFWNGHPDLHYWWCLTKWDYDGATAFGETQDFASFQDWRRILRKLPAATA